MDGFTSEEQDQLFDFLERMKHNAIRKVADIKDFRRHHGGMCSQDMRKGRDEKRK